MTDVRHTALLTAALTATILVSVPRGADAQDNQQGAVINTASDLYLGQPEVLPPEPEDPHEHSIAVEFGGFADVLDLSGLGLVFGAPELQAIEGLSFDHAALRSLTTGGLTINVSPRFWQVLRFPELRLTLGGGSFDTGYVPIRSAPEGVSIRPDSLFLFRIELAGGLQFRLGPVTPYAMVRAGFALYSLSGTVQHDELGVLGSESASGGAFEVATEVGLSIRLHENIELGAAWRRTWVGATGDGAVLTLTFVGD